MATDTSSLSPSDGAVALRSFPRRFGAVLADDPDRPDDEPGPDDLLHRTGPDGSSIADRVGHAIAVLHVFEQALRDVTGSGRAVPPAVADASGLGLDEGAGRAADLHDQLTGAAETMAATVDRIDADRWSRTAPVAGGGEVDAITVLRRAVAHVADDLRAATAVRDAVVGT